RRRARGSTSRLSISSAAAISRSASTSTDATRKRFGPSNPDLNRSRLQPLCPLAQGIIGCVLVQLRQRWIVVAALNERLRSALQHQDRQAHVDQFGGLFAN